jgi:hypothetical protein
MMSYDPNQKCSYSDSEFDGSSRASTITADLASLPRNDRNRRRKFTKQRSCLVRASSASSVADTVFSGNQNTTIVRLNREHGGTLGIRAIEYQGEIYVESILKGCVVDLDKRIQPGDIILQVKNLFLLQKGSVLVVLYRFSYKNFFVLSRLLFLYSTGE